MCGEGGEMMDDWNRDDWNFRNLEFQNFRILKWY
jgi:hypothetical protein